MARINLILADPEYFNYLDKNRAAEEDRVYCGHDFAHLVSTARLTWIFLLEEGNPYISREIAYAAALLHDIGRFEEYTSGGDHALISAGLARPILERAGFSAPEIALITEAIKEHRQKDEHLAKRSSLSAALFKADNHARLCFLCPAAGTCHKIKGQPHKKGLLY